MDYSTFGTEFSVAFWYKIDTAFSGNRHLVCLCNQYGWSQLKFTCAATSNSTLTFNIGDGSTSAKSLSTSQIIGSWQHICFTFNNKIAKVYVNGVQTGTATYPINPDWSGTTKMGIGGAPDGNERATTLSLNDIRIYNHCLSPLEVKEISKGLVLHYPLSDEYIESTINLVTTEDGLSNTCYNGSTGKYSYGTNTDMYKTLGVFEGRKSTKVYMGTAGLSAYPYIYFDNFNASGTTIQTLSFDYYPTIQNTLVPYSYNGSYNFSYTTDKTSGSANNASQIIIPVEVGRWNHITITAQKTDTTNASRGIGYVRIGSTSHISTTTDYWLFSNVQVEAKDHATGYAGVGGTRNSTTVYDTSGFCNNGIAFGIFTVSNNTPKYNVSTVFNGTDNAIQTPSLPSMISDKNYTIAVWIYKTVIGSKSYQTIYGGPSGFEIEARNGGANETKFVPWNWGKPMASYELNEWNHCVFVHSDSDCKIYLNGEYIATGSAKAANPSGDYFVGAWKTSTGQNYEGLMSDFRIYATALSADDVKSLYNNSAYIDNQGNIYGAVYEEV